MKIFLGEGWQRGWVMPFCAVFDTVLNYNIRSPCMLFLYCKEGNKSGHGQILIPIIT